MHFHRCIYLLTTIVALMQCQEQISETTEAPHAVTQVANCFSRDIRTQISANKVNVRVKLHNMHVALRPDPGYEFDPSMVLVAQCSGHCRGRRVPMPTRSDKASFVVNRYPVGQPDAAQCVNVEVDNHTMCKCMCKKTQADCTVNQTWVEDNCDCKCNANFQKPKVDCLAQHTTMEWDPVNCKCRCRKEIMQCMTGWNFNTEICQCVEQ